MQALSINRSDRVALMNFTITECKLNLNESVIKVVRSHNVIIHGLECTKNTNNWVAACLTAFQSSINLTDSRIEDNTGRVGGALFVADGSNIAIHNGKIHRNAAHETGGAIQAVKSDLSLYNTSFEENVSELSGGALYFEVCFICDQQ